MLLERALPAAPVITPVRASRPPVALWAAAAAFLLHAIGNPHYGFYRDELYFIICGLHPALGYVDQPSLAPLLAAASQAFGASLFALRLIPAVCAGLATYAACLFAAELGGGIFALVLTGVVAIVTPEMMAFGLRLAPDMIEFWTWPLIALLVLRIAKGADPRWWLAVAAFVAVAGWGKYSVAFFLVALLGGLLVTPQRRILATPWFAAAVAIGALAMLPSLLWQWQYGFPMLQLLHNDYGKFVMENPPFPVQQILVMSPLLSIVWIAGLVWLMRAPQTRFLGIAYLILIPMMWALDAKSYYAAPIYPFLIGAGGVCFEAWTRRRTGWRKPIVAAAILFAIPSTPFVLPILPIHTLIRYQQFLGRTFGVWFHTDTRAGNDVAIQYYADMTGWPELTGAVARVYESLPASQRPRAAIFAHNFGEASALRFFGGPYHLPPALSGNNNYWIWGPQGYTGDVLIDVNGNAAEDRRRFRSVRLATIFRNPLAMPYENNLPIYVCTGIKQPLAQIWPELRDYSYGFVKL